MKILEKCEKREIEKIWTKTRENTAVLFCLALFHWDFTKKTAKTKSEKNLGQKIVKIQRFCTA